MGYMRTICIIIFSLGLSSCSRTTNNKSSIHADSVKIVLTDTTKTVEIDYESLFKLDSYLVTNIVDTSRIQTIDFDCAILVYPTDEQIEEIKKEEGADNFYTIADDNNWYQGLAIEMVDSVGINKEGASRQFIQLIGQDKTWTLNLRKKGLPTWNMIFFKRNKEPLIIQTISLTTEKVRDYFEVKK